MKQAVALTITAITLLSLGQLVLGHTVVFLIGIGTISIMSCLIGVTFFWLWFQRTTPLALGMAFSWIGIGLILGWWWLFEAQGRPVSMSDAEVLLGFVALHAVGAVLHFSVIETSFGLRRRIFLVPVVASLLISGLAIALFQ